MNIFGMVRDFLKGKLGEDQAGPVPGAMGKLLASMGIHEFGEFNRRGIPPSVLGGCKQELVLMPGSSKPALGRDGKPMMAKDKKGRQYQVMDTYGVPVKRWKQMQRDQERKAKGKYFNGETDAERDARRARLGLA